MQTLPQFKVLQRGEQPSDEGYHVLLVHRFSSDWRALVHDITSRVPPSAGKVCHLTDSALAIEPRWVRGRRVDASDRCAVTNAA